MKLLFQGGPFDGLELEAKTVPSEYLLKIDPDPEEFDLPDFYRYRWIGGANYEYWP